MTIPVLDLFCGAAGGWSLGLHQTGSFTTVAACEKDRWRSDCFRRLNPSARMYHDVTTLTAQRLRRDGVPWPRVGVGSPPCQDASQANAKGRGVDGHRTGLIFDAIRICAAECGCDWICLENVPGLRTRGYDRVHDALEREGYAVWPVVVGAAHVGAPHLRERVWIIAHARREISDRGNARAGWRELGAAAFAANAAHSHQGAGDSGARQSGHQLDAQKDREEPEAGRGLPTIAGCDLSLWGEWNGGAPRFDRMDDGISKGVAGRIIAAYGDAVIPAIPRLIGKFIAQLEAA